MIPSSAPTERKSRARSERIRIHATLRRMRGRRVAISIGCPGGVGAEVALGALATTSDREVLFGDRALLEARAPLVGFDPRRLISLENAGESSRLEEGRVGVVQVGAPLSDDARRPGR